MRATLTTLACAILLSGCSVDEPSDTTSEIRRFPDVIGVEVTETAENVFTFAVTISSPYDTPERYADAWRIKGADGTVYGIRELTHDHASEQPFTRSLTGVEIPEEAETVTIEGRDLDHGWGGETVSIDLP